LNGIMALQCLLASLRIIRMMGEEIGENNAGVSI
jgi:hypothetical protein